MKNRLLFSVSLLCVVFVLGGCKKGESTSQSAVSIDAGIRQISEETTVEDMYVVLIAGEETEHISVNNYGEEIVLPEGSIFDMEGEFVGWLGARGIFSPGDSVVSEENMYFEGVWTSADSATLVTVDEKYGGSAYITFDNKVEMYSPYDEGYFNDVDEYFVAWRDSVGKEYFTGDLIELENNKVIILYAEYSDDLSNAYKISINYNPPEERFEEVTNYRYVEKGESIPVWLMIEYADYEFLGWYDAKEGGNYITNDMEKFTPDGDTELFARWKK